MLDNLNERTVWELMTQGKTLAEICEPIPDEWHDWIKMVYKDIDDHLTKMIAAVLAEYSAIKPGLDRESFAMIVSKSENRALLFKLYDGKRISDDILFSLKPSVSKE